jgi:hypothetical protein
MVSVRILICITIIPSSNNVRVDKQHLTTLGHKGLNPRQPALTDLVIECKLYMPTLLYRETKRPTPNNQLKC